MRKQIKILNKLILSFLLIFIISACSIKQPYVERNLYNISLNTPLTYVKSVKKYNLLLPTVRVNAAYENPALVYKVGENKFIEDYYNEFIAQPGRLIGENISAYLNALNQRFNVEYIGGIKSFDFALEIYVDSFYGDYTVSPPKAVTVLDFSFIDLRNKKAKTVFTKRIRKESAFLEKNTEDMVEALKGNLNSILIEFNEDLNNIKF